MIVIIAVYDTINMYRSYDLNFKYLNIVRAEAPDTHSINFELLSHHIIFYSYFESIRQIRI